MIKEIKKDIAELLASSKLLDKKVVAIFIAIAVLQTISWYFTSGDFFVEVIAPTWFPDLATPRVFQFLYWFAGDFLVLFVIPILIITLFFKENVEDYGIKAGDVKTGIRYVTLALIVMLPILWVVSAQPEFVAQYPHLKSAKNNVPIFIAYEFGILVFLFAWEFIWRGFTLFGLKLRFGVYSIFIQMIPFVILHNGKPALETFGAILGGLALGALAYRTGSYFYGVIIHFGVMFFIDLISVLRYHSEEYGVGLAALLNLLNV